MKLNISVTGVIARLLVVMSTCGVIITPAVAQDLVDPVSQISTPVAGGPAGSSITVTGTASDNVAVDRVVIAIRNLSAVPPTDTFTLAVGANNWSHTFTPSTPGTYRVAAIAVDASGNRQTTYNGTTFNVTAAGSVADLVPPNSQISTPIGDGSVGSSMTISGSATDDVSVDRVVVAIRNLTTNSSDVFAIANGATSWSHSFTPAASGIYRVCLLYTSPSPRDRG